MRELLSKSNTDFWAAVLLVYVALLIASPHLLDLLTYLSVHYVHGYL